MHVVALGSRYLERLDTSRASQKVGVNSIRQVYATEKLTAPDAIGTGHRLRSLGGISLVRSRLILPDDCEITGLGPLCESLPTGLSLGQAGGGQTFGTMTILCRGRSDVLQRGVTAFCNVLIRAMYVKGQSRCHVEMSRVYLKPNYS